MMSNNTSTLTSQRFTTKNQSRSANDYQLAVRGQLGYGLGLKKSAGVYTPAVGFELNKDHHQKIDLGHKLEFDSNLNIELKLSWHYQNVAFTEQVANLRGGIKW